MVHRLTVYRRTHLTRITNWGLIQGICHDDRTREMYPVLNLSFQVNSEHPNL